MDLSRRGFLKALGIGAAAVVVPELVLEPRRRLWQVSRKAPVAPGAALWRRDPTLVSLMQIGADESQSVGFKFYEREQISREQIADLRIGLHTEHDLYGQPITLSEQGHTYFPDSHAFKLDSEHALDRIVRQSFVDVIPTPAGRFQLAADMHRAGLLESEASRRAAEAGREEAAALIERTLDLSLKDLVRLADQSGNRIHLSLIPLASPGPEQAREGDV